MTNAIVQENARTDGVAPKSYWDVPHSTQIEGFATDISVDAGGQIDFKINVNGDAGSDYVVEIFRLGYYDGNGARKVAEWTNTDAVVQPDPDYDAARGLVDAGNWSVTDSWDTPEDAVSGVYLARVQRLDENGDPIEGAANQIPFIIRDDDRDADIVLQTSDTTWHAYNGWFGNNGEVGANFYGDASGTIDHPDIPGAGNFAQDRAYAVSYNRPLITRGIEGGQGGPAAGAQDYLFGADYAAISWLEQNGYDVAYISGMDTDRLGPDYLKKYDAYISVGHDEYWSGDQRANVEEARDAGVNLLFWGGNDMYWKTRWETSIVDGVEYRTLVCYKETWAVADPNAGPDDYYNLDPSDIWTGTWRDVRFLGNPEAGVGTGDETVSGGVPMCHCAENSLIGTLFGPDATGTFGGALDIPEEFAPLRVWRDTSYADGGALDVSEGILGYEWNTAPDDENRPAGLIKLSETTIPWDRIVIDQGNTTAPGTATHNLTMYRADSGALVFSAGTVFWTWALSNEHDSEPYGADIENVDLQQFTVNMFADMGIQPGVSDTILASQGLIRAIASADQSDATATMDDLPDSVSALQTVIITGTATDDDGDAGTEDGVVALVEISFDGGQTWSPVNGTTNWSYSWTPAVEGNYDIVVRAIDDSLNLPDLASLPPQILEVTEAVIPETVSLFEPFTAYDGVLASDAQPLHLGTNFSSSVAGQVTELKYYRDAADADDTDVRNAYLWDSSGTLLASAQFVSAPGESGWQTVALNVPVSILAGQQYVVSYETTDNYAATNSFFGGEFTEPFGVLSAPDAAGVYAYSGSPVLPTNSFQDTFYWVDVTFAPAPSVNEAPVIVSGVSYSLNENTIAVGLVQATDANADQLTYSIEGGADASLFSINPNTGALSFVAPPDFETPADAGADNQYDLVVGASDGIAPVTQQSITVTVNDVEPEGGPGEEPTNVFGATDTPDLIATNDPTDYELGMRFETNSDGIITALRYYRGAEDASDTDVRTLNLWSDTGLLLASATVTSAPGEIGWQTVDLSTPVNAADGDQFVVSYGTTQNYAVSQNYFTSAATSDDGLLVAPANLAGESNGLYSAGSTGVFPQNSYLSSNYWVDVDFEAGAVGPNGSPAFTLTDFDFQVNENQTQVASLAATDPDGDTFVFAIAGGADASAFNIDPNTGALTFASPPDFENPGDSNGDNIYDVIVSVADAFNPAVEQVATVTVADVDESGPQVSTLFGPADTPDQIVTFDPTDYELGVEFTIASDGQVTGLRYYRGAADADDTDIRVLNLWAEDGTKLASVTVQSDPGESGWQVGTLSTPIDLEAGSSYIVSYGTTQNYAFSGSFFGSDWTGPDGQLTAPADSGQTSNGVYAAGAVDQFPTQSYNASNYWVDVIVDTSAATQGDEFIF
jgi:hypothetical protein